MGEEEKDNMGKLFENFVQASTCKGTVQAFSILCRHLDLDPADNSTFYSSLKAKVTYWKAKALWSKLDKRMSHKEYKKGQACVGTKCLVIGGGPCGLRTAIELALMGAKVVVIEKRDSFSRHNVLHLWPYTIHDLRGLGAKKFYGKFCAGAIDHISIQQLQLILLKVALIVAVEFHINVEFVNLVEPSEDQENEGLGWRAAVHPVDHPVANFEFDVVVGADGRRNTLEGFKRKEFRGKLAIAITANFINRNTTAEAKVEEISGVAFIFNQKFFLDLKEETGIDLENIVYYKDNTHYFVMTAKKQSLLDKRVVINDYIDTQMLLSGENVNQEALLCYAREAADFGTNYQLPTLDFAMNHCGQPDVAMFDFTSMHASENAALVRERFGHQLLVALVGDSLLEVRRSKLCHVKLIHFKESIYRLLPQTTPENIAKNFEQYTIDPGTRYPNLISSCVKPHQVRHLYISRELNSCSLERAATIRRPVNLCRRETEIRPARLLTWCQKQTEGYKNVTITDLTSSWQSGIALCALIHKFKPQLIDFDSLNDEDHAANLQLAFDVSERELGIRSFMSVKELSAGEELDKTGMITYLSKLYELFRGTPLPTSGSSGMDENNKDYSAKEVRSNNNVLNLPVPRKRVPKPTNLSSNGSSVREGQDPKENKVRSMATQLLAKFESTPNYTIRKPQPLLFLCLFNNGFPYLSEKSQSDCEKSSPVQILDLTESLHIKLRPPVPPKPPPEIQKKAQVQQTREFHTKSIKEKAVHLSGLFSGDSSAVVKVTISRLMCDPTPVYCVALPAPYGKLYCKLHFEQRNNTTNLRRNFSLRSNHCGVEVHKRQVDDDESSQSISKADQQSKPAAGRLLSFIRTKLSWPLRVTRAVCNAPWYLSHHACSTAQALTGHLRDNAQDYTFLYELLGTSLPLLFVLQEVLLQMYLEAVPDGQSSLQLLLLWLQEHIGHRLI
ncbi:[F-actin]-monooxygenase MICAL2 [Channa argus]|uniref:F-actin monooxygenase n=1 Tax=Channa argus TaxID=215402 RepID=A0A6G1P8K6_CHAAH|nr:[F-actin]-monooxygenase MICAL2 [Channa argus]